MRLKTFRSRTDLIGFLLIWGIPVGLYLYFLLQKGLIHVFSIDTIESALFVVLFNGTFVLIFGFIFRLARSIKYEINDATLSIKMLSTCHVIKVARITRMSRSYLPLSAPALSLRRIAIYTSGNKLEMLISPKREKEFLKIILQINPDIELRNLST